MIKKHIAHELRFPLKWLELVGPIPLKHNQKTNKMELQTFKYIFNMVMLISILAAMIYFPLIGAISDGTSDTKAKILALSSILSLILKYGLALYDCLFEKTFITNYWYEIVNLDRTCRQLNLHCEINNKLVFLVVLTPTLLDYLFNICTIYLNKTMEIQYKVLTALGHLMTGVLISMIAFLFISLLTIVKNYFKQLNELLVITLDKHPRNSWFILNNIAKLHQYFYELSKTSLQIFSMQIITILGNCVVVITNYVYYSILMIINQEYDDLGFAVMLWPIIEALLSILFIIIPCELCMVEVRVID